MGGQPSLGYDVCDRKLIINDTEVDTVRMIFRRYADLRSVRALKDSLDASGIVSKAQLASDGTPYGSRPFSLGALYHLLQNRIYRGEIVHKDNSYPGEHPAIVDEALWTEVQGILARNALTVLTAPHPRNPVCSPARLRRAGIEMRMMVDNGSEPAIDTGLVRTLVRAFAIRDQLFKDRSLTIDEVAEREGIVPSYASARQ